MDWLLKTVQPNKLVQSDIYSLVLEKISPQEHVKLAIFVDAITHQASLHGRSMVLSVICNVDSEFEQAALLLLSSATAFQPAAILAVLPIVAGLDIALSEPASPSGPQDPLSRLGSSAPKVLRCRFSVAGSQLIEVSSLDLQALKDAISEVRRLTAIANDRQIFNSSLLGPWIDRYISRKKTSDGGPGRISSDGGTDKPLSAQDSLSKLLTSPPVSPPATFSSSSQASMSHPNRRQSIAPDLPEWRQNWLSERLRELEDTYAESRKIKVRVGTWNVYGKQPVESLQDWIVPDGELHKSDLYVICLQEIDDTSEAYIRYTPFRENLWSEVVHKTIEASGTGQRVIKVASQQLVGLLILVFVDERMAKEVSDVATTYVGTGTLGMGNKGATAVRLRCSDTYLTLVNTHLAAFQDQTEARNRDYVEICRRLVFPPRTAHTQPKVHIPRLSFAGGGPVGPPPSAEIFQTGHLIWAGDLNYRLNTTYAHARSQAEGAFTEEVCAALLAHDQLGQQIEAGKAFQMFEEGAITFRPTYKFDVGTSQYDSSEKQRIPAYTDRILYLPGRVNDIEVLSYDSYPSQTMSDHKPVAATLQVAIYTIQTSKRDALVSELLRELDGLENEAVPDLDIEPEEGMTFEVPVSAEQEGGGGAGELRGGGGLVGQSVVLTNKKKSSGAKPVGWQIVEKPAEGVVCEEWLKISQLSGSVSKGGQEAIHFAVDPVGAHRKWVQLGMVEEVGEVVVLSIEGGRDVFIPINVRFVGTPEGGQEGEVEVVVGQTGAEE